MLTRRNFLKTSAFVPLFFANLPVMAQTMAGDRNKWAKLANPVLVPSQAWENSTVYEPKCTLLANGDIVMAYGGGWNSAGIGIAVSTDGGRTWTKNPNNPILGGGSAIKAGGVVLAAHHDIRQLPDGRFDIIFCNSVGNTACFQRAFSLPNDYTTWTVDPIPVLSFDTQYNPTPSNPVRVSTPNGREVLLYTSLDPSPPATGYTWKQYLAHRVDDEGFAYLRDTRGAASSMQIVTVVNGIERRGAYDVVSIIKIGDWYYGWAIIALNLNGTSWNNPSDIYTVRSKDLFTWEHLNNKQPSLWKTLAWESLADQIADPHVVVRGSECLMFYDAVANTATPDAKIGLATFNGTPEQLVS